MSLVHIARELRAELSGLEFQPPAAFVYDPLTYAWRPHECYLERYGDGVPGAGRALLVGMNPGPWGMAQTGIPFGAVERVREWLGIEEPVEHPEREHPKKPVLGFACQRQEVSGDRLWSWAEQRFGTPQQFFQRFFVWNYCPLLFLEESGRNLTPDKLGPEDRAAILDPCDRALQRVTKAIGASRVIGVGAFAEGRAVRALGDQAPPIDRILHPSPASPAANRGWAEAAERQLVEMGALEPR